MPRHPPRLSPEHVLAGLATRLRQLRLARKLTQAELAERAGLSTVTVSKSETGHNLTLLNLLRLLEALGELEQAAAWIRPAPRSLDDVLRGGDT